MSKVQKKGTRVQVVLDSELMLKVDRIRLRYKLESYPQTLRLIIKYFQDEVLDMKKETI